MSSAKEALREFVDAYNEVNDFFEANLATGNNENSVLARSGEARRFRLQLQSMISRGVPGLPDGSLRALFNHCGEKPCRVRCGTGARVVLYIGNDDRPGTRLPTRPVLDQRPRLSHREAVDRGA